VAVTNGAAISAAIVSNNAVTIACWVKTTGAGYRYICHDMEFGGSEEILAMVIWNDGTFQYANGDSLWRSSGIAVNDGSWHHVVAQQRGTTWTLYVDGIVRTTGETTTLEQSQYVGRPNDPVNYWFVGDVDDFRIYSSILTSNEVFNLYNAGNGTEGNDTVAFPVHLTMNDNAANTTVVNSNGVNATAAANTSTKSQSGKVGTSLNFNGTTDKITLNATEAAAISASCVGANACMIMFWIKTSGDNYYISGYDNKFLIGLGCGGNSGKLAFYNASGAWTAGNTAINDGNWHHVGVGFSNSTAVTFFHNGAPDGTANVSAAMTTCAGYVVGTDNAGTAPLVGNLDDWRWYTRDGG
jgi:hypothetical protein